MPDSELEEISGPRCHRKLGIDPRSGSELQRCQAATWALAPAASTQPTAGIAPDF